MAKYEGEKTDCFLPTTLCTSKSTYHGCVILKAGFKKAENDPNKVIPYVELDKEIPEIGKHLIEILMRDGTFRININFNDLSKKEILD